MRTIRHVATLFHYDGPQVFEARDAIGGHYIAVMIEPEGETDRYMVAGVEPEQLRLFRSGEVDLRSLLTNSAIDEWYVVPAPMGVATLRLARPEEGRLEESELLPESGFVLHDRPAEEVALQEARARNNLVLELTAEPPEAAEEHRIRLTTLVGLLGHVQSMIKHAYGAALRDLAPESRLTIEKTDGHLMDVVIPAAPGSFRVVLEASRRPDLVGHCELSRALQRVDLLFANVGEPAAALATVKANRGHLAGAYLRLLQFLIEHKTGLRYAWALPGARQASHRSIAESQARPLVDLLGGVSNIGSEPLVLVGQFDKMNRSTGSWGLLTDKGLVSGVVREGGPSLDGLKAGARYQFNCVEELQEIEGTGRERRTIYLVGHEPA